MSIYKISDNLRNIYRELEDGSGIDIETGEIKPEIINQLSISREELQLKAIDYGYVIKSFDDKIEAINNEIDRLNNLKKQAQNVKERMKDIVAKAMIEFGIVEIKGDTLKLSFRKSESLEIIDESLIEDKFKRVKVEPDKIAIKQALKSGQDVQGVKLVEKQNLQIK